MYGERRGVYIAALQLAWCLFVVCGLRDFEEEMQALKSSLELQWWKVDKLREKTSEISRPSLFQRMLWNLHHSDDSIKFDDWKDVSQIYDKMNHRWKWLNTIRKMRKMYPMGRLTFVFMNARQSDRSHRDQRRTKQPGLLLCVLQLNHIILLYFWPN